MHAEPINPDFAARVSGVDLGVPLDEAARRQIVRWADSYGVLVFPGQHLSQEQLLAFGRQFGPLETGVQKKLMNNWQKRLDNDAVSDVSNVTKDGNLVDPDSRMAQMAVGNRMWHSDASYQNIPWRYSVLSCLCAVSRGGQTEFADLRAAYDSLDQNTKALVEDKVGIFYSHFSRQTLGIEDPAAELAAYPPVRWPMVRTHPGSGRKLLWCDTKTCAIEGMRLYEARGLVSELLEHITQPKHVYSHNWASGDLVLYDNRSVLHRGRRFDPAERREMRRIAIIDDCPSLGELPFDRSLLALKLWMNEQEPWAEFRHTPADSVGVYGEER